MSLGKIPKLFNNISFKGYDKRLDNKGNNVHSFYYPHSDEYNLQLELLTRQKNNNNRKTMSFDIKGDLLNLQIPDGMDMSHDIYYRFKLTDKTDKSKAPIYAIDNGLIKDMGEINGSSNPFNQIFVDRKIVSKPGRMQLQIPDMYYPGVKYSDGKYCVDKDERKIAISTVRNHVNKLGGTLNGMIYMLPTKAKEGYTRIVGTPFTKDEVSSHLYWTQNAYQMASSIGTMQDMKRFQQTLFKNGINYVMDAALVNEGLQGIHIANIMKWGKDSPFYQWFKTYNLDTNVLKLGVIPENSENVRMKIINSPIVTDANPVENKKYNPQKPTYVQLYDARLVTKDQEKSDKLFTAYKNKAGNHYDITRYDDVIVPYAIEVNSQELAKNIRKADAFKNGDFADINTIMNILSFSKFEVGERSNGGIELWDGNVDIPKLNFSFGNYDEEIINKGTKVDIKNSVNEYKQGVREVQDYAVLSGNFWAKLSSDTQLEFAANVFKKVNSVRDAVNRINEQVGNNLPNLVQKVVNKEIIDNVFNNDYNLFKLNNISTYTKITSDNKKEKVQTSNYRDILTKSIMNLPLEAVETGDDITSILSSGYLTKRASTDEQIGLSRFDIYKSNYPNQCKKYAELYKRTDTILNKDVYNLIDKIISSYEKLSGSEKIKDGNNATIFGKYVINAIASDLTKFALIKSLDENANISVEKDGSLNFDNIDRTRLTVNALGISGKNPKEEALNLIKKLEKGISKLNTNQAEINKMVTAITTRLNGLNENSFKMADMIIDRTESGIGLRVDASKDVAAFDSVRVGKDDVSKAWNDVINFWSRYVKDGIQKENPHAYTTAEVTDIANFIDKYNVADLNSAPEADRKMLEKAGVTSIANYSYFFSMPTGIFSMNPETGDWNGFGIISNIKSKIDGLDNPGWRDNSGFIFEGMPDSSIHSYTFVGNHDKPRILHVLGLDMALYNSDFSDAKSRAAAMYVLDNENEVNFDDFYITNGLSAPAVAMGKRLKDVFREMAGWDDRTEDFTNSDSALISRSEYNKISNSIRNLVMGIYKENDEKVTEYNPDSFGEKPFDVVINDVMKTANLNIDKKRYKDINDKALEKMLIPPMEKFKSIYKMLVLLPGDPTDFAGDKEGMTGFESLAKNLSQQNRNAIRWEWLDERSDEYKPFIAKYNLDINNIMALRKRPELSALNNGHTVSLVNYKNLDELEHSEKRDYSANLRYNDKSMILTVFGRPDLGNYPDPNKGLGDKPVSIDYIDLNKKRLREGLAAGLSEGTIFKNENDNDKTIYKVVKENDKYLLKRFNGTSVIPIIIDKKDDNAIVLYRV